MNEAATMAAKIRGHIEKGSPLFAIRLTWISMITGSESATGRTWVWLRHDKNAALATARREAMEEARQIALQPPHAWKKPAPVSLTHTTLLTNLPG